MNDDHEHHKTDIHDSKVSTEAKRAQDDYINFEADARTVILLGEDNIKDHNTAIVELIKNGYDADADNVSVNIANTGTREITTTTIEDDGDGMDEDDISKRWAVVGTHSKSADPQTKVKKKTPKGRVQLGAKGIGRFSAQKLGRKLQLITRKKDSNTEIVIEADWSKFKTKMKLENVRIPLRYRRPDHFAGDRHGTYLRMQEPSESIGVVELRKLQTSLMRLLTPSEDAPNFNVTLQLPAEHAELENIDRADWLEKKFQFKLECEVTEKGKMKWHYTERKKPNLTHDVDKETMVEDSDEINIWSELHPEKVDANIDPACGKFKMEVYAWMLKPEVFKELNIREGKTAMAKEQIKRLSGISLYRDGFRLIPYGDEDNDWLNINIRRVNQPAKILSTNQIIGHVDIGFENNLELDDKASREGVQENQAFHDLRDIVNHILTMFGNMQSDTRGKMAGKKKPKKTVSTEIEKLTVIIQDLKDENKELLERLLDLVVPEEQEGLPKEFKKSQTLVHEGAKAAKEVQNEVKKRAPIVEEFPEIETTDLKGRKMILHLLLLGHFAEAFKSMTKMHLGSLVKNLEIINQRHSDITTRTALGGAKVIGGEMRHLEKGTYKTQKRERTKVDSVIKSCIEAFSERAEESKVRIEYDGKSGLETDMDFFQLYKVVYCIVDNAVYWTKSTITEIDRRIVKISVEEEAGCIVVSNAGTKVDPSMVKASLNGFEFTTTKSDNSLGIGLWLSNATMREYGGSVVHLDEQDPFFRPNVSYKISL